MITSSSPAQTPTVEITPKKRKGRPKGWSPYNNPKNVIKMEERKKRRLQNASAAVGNTTTTTTKPSLSLSPSLYSSLYTLSNQSTQHQKTVPTTTTTTGTTGTTGSSSSLLLSQLPSSLLTNSTAAGNNNNNASNSSILPKPITTSEKKLVSGNETPQPLTATPTRIKPSSSPSASFSMNLINNNDSDKSDLNSSTFTTTPTDLVTPNTSIISLSSSSPSPYNSNNNNNSFEVITVESPKQTRPRTYQIQTRNSARLSNNNISNTSITSVSNTTDVIANNNRTSGRTRSSSNSFQKQYIDDSSLDLSLEYPSGTYEEEESETVPEIDLNISSPDIKPLSPFSRSEHEVQTSPKLGENCNYPTSIYYGEKDRYRRDPKS